MSDLSITAVRVARVRDVAGEMLSDIVCGPAAEAITAGQYVRLDTNAGTWTKGNATSAGEARRGGIALSGGGANTTIRVLRKGYLDLGNALSALAYDADVYLSDTDGALATTAGTVSLVVGTVVPAWGGGASGVADKLLRVDL